ncbi:HAD family hydrolase [bacterium]|nr:HAD family hydrolase [bacterium]
MKNIIFDIHNTICYQKYAAEYFIDKSYQKLLTYSTERISYSLFREVWFDLDFEYQEETQKGYNSLSSKGCIGVETYLREIPYIEKFRTLLSRIYAGTNGYFPKIINDHFQRHWIKGLTLFPFTLTVFEELHQYNLGIVSNFRDAKWLNNWIQNHTLDVYFHDNIVISENEGYRKPNPILFSKILELMRVKPDDLTYYVGDNEVEDRLGASLVGIRPLIIGKEISSIEELPLFFRESEK